MKLSWQKKQIKWKLNSASHIISCNFLHNIHRAVLFVNPCYQATQATRLYVIFTIWPTTDVLFVLICFYANTFYILFSSMGRCSIQYVWYFLFLVFDGLPNILSFIYELLINTSTNFFENSLKCLSKHEIQDGTNIFACNNSTQQSYSVLHLIYI